MITSTKAYKTSNGKTFETLPEAQAQEISLVICEAETTASPLSASDAEFAAKLIVASKDKIIDILSTKESSRPAARKINGGKKTRKAKTETTVTTPTK